jgi:hypothetical protein
MDRARIAPALDPRAALTQISDPYEKTRTYRSAAGNKARTPSRAKGSVF